MKKILIALMIIYSVRVSAQTKGIVHRGTIQFERKMNMHNQIDDMMKSGNSSWLERAKERLDRYKVDKFEMMFTKEQSIYQPAKDGISELKMPWINVPSEKNIVFNNYKENKVVSKKEIYDKTILITDTLPKRKWKIKEEFRDIAGYSCRRAETIIMDSVWVVAFYTDAIIAPGGPESFNGLPGMILGVVMPRLNVTYFATDVKPYTDARREINPPKKGKKHSNESFVTYLRSNMKQWGDWMQRVLWYSGI